MDGTFACPECFSEIVPHGASAGRRVRCSDCGTIVEVPFLLRAGKSSRRTPRQSVWIWVGLGTAAVLLLIAAATRFLKNHAEQTRELEISSHVHAAKEAERSGRSEQALIELDAALSRVRDDDHNERHELAELRNKISVRDAETLLNQAEAAAKGDVIEADRAARQIQALKLRSKNDDALAPFRDRIDGTLAQLLTQQSERALAMARQELDADRPDTAIKLCEDAFRDADCLPSVYADPLRGKARAEAARAVARFGVVIDPVKGEFVQGPSSGLIHSASLQPSIAGILHRHGFVPRPEDSPFRSVWDESAPYHLTIEVDESYNGVYFQSPLRTSAMTAQLTLTQLGTTRWQARASGRTRVPPPKMTAFEARNLAVAKTREPALEKRLYDDARAVLADSIAAIMRSLPAP